MATCVGLNASCRIKRPIYLFTGKNYFSRDSLRGRIKGRWIAYTCGLRWASQKPARSDRGSGTRNSCHYLGLVTTFPYAPRYQTSAILQTCMVWSTCYRKIKSRGVSCIMAAQNVMDHVLNNTLIAICSVSIRYLYISCKRRERHFTVVNDRMKTSA